MKVFAGAENIISPLGKTATENFDLVAKNQSGISKHSLGGMEFMLSKIDRNNFNFKGSFWQHLLKSSIEDSLNQLTKKPSNIHYVVSSAKGEIENLTRGIFAYGLSHSVKNVVGDKKVICISNACISGLLALNTAYDMVVTGRAETVVVAGVDTIADFVVSGFNSLFALDSERCKPFDEDRKGLNLGEGAGTIIVSSRKEIFREEPLEFLGGFSNNDANHISGPSRTGEGLKKAIKRLQEATGVDPDFLNAHGTGTPFNDAMEAQAFNAIGYRKTPTNALKCYFGHTLGAAGIIETALCMQSVKKGVVPATLGFKKLGTEREVNILDTNLVKETSTFVKTCSGFGGGNAAVAFRKC